MGYKDDVRLVVEDLLTAWLFISGVAMVVCVGVCLAHRWWLPALACAAMLALIIYLFWIGEI